MNWIPIKKNERLTRQVFLNYLNYEWKKRVLRQKIWFICLPIAVITLVLQLERTSSSDDYNYHFFVFALISSIIYLPFLYCYQRMKYIRWVKGYEKQIPPAYEFAFNDKGLYYQLPDCCSDRKWADYKFYELNEDEVYIYTRSGKIGEVIVAENIGTERFEDVMEIVRTKLKPKYSK